MDYNKIEDIDRFMYYDASLHYRDKRNIRTIVIYSSDIKEVSTNLNCGTINYNIEAFYMSKFDAVNELNNIKTKVHNNQELSKTDIMTLCFIPLMNSKKSKSDLTIESIEAANNITDKKSKNNCIMLLYALFDKFGDDKSKKKFKEVINMTDVGKMIYNDGIEEGKKEGKSDMLIKQLIMKFKALPENYINKLRELPQETIEIISLSIFDLKSLDDLAKYF